MKPLKFTAGERLLLHRRRLGLSQVERAKKHRVTLYRYRGWEEGRVQPQARIVPGFGRVRDFEACYVLRRRSGIALQSLAALLRMTPNWLCEIEHGRQPATRLVAHWLRQMKKEG